MTITWAAIDSKYRADPNVHLQACETAGLSCPVDVFEQLFHEHHTDPSSVADVMAVDWSGVVWEEQLLTGELLRQIAVPRGFQFAVDEPRARTLLYGLKDDRPEVLASWRESGTWVRSPVIVEGDVLANVYRYELLVGFTRLGDLLGMLDRGEVSVEAAHRVWVGRLKA